MENNNHPGRKLSPKALRVLITGTFGLAVIGIVAVCIGLFGNQASTLFIGIALLTVAGVLGLLFMNLLFPRRP